MDCFAFWYLVFFYIVAITKANKEQYYHWYVIICKNKICTYVKKMLSHMNVFIHVYVKLNEEGKEKRRKGGFAVGGAKKRLLQRERKMSVMWVEMVRAEGQNVEEKVKERDREVQEQER